MLGLNSPVSYGSSITTIDKLARSGGIRFRMTPNCGNQSPYHSEYHAMTDHANGWRISKLAYQSAIAKYPQLAGEFAEPESIISRPYTFAEYQEAISQKLSTPALLPYMWLLDADSTEWRKSYQWLLNASESDIIAYAARVDDPNWDESMEPYSS
jgi:hypothetical protein